MEARVNSQHYEKYDSKPNRKATVSRTIWRWHFYAGVFVSPFLIILAISGGLYLFKSEIESALYHDQFYIESEEGKETPLDLNEQLDRVTNRLGNDVQVLSVKQYDEASRTTEVNYMADEKVMNGYVNPYTGEYQGSLVVDKMFSSIFRKIHSEWFIGGTLVNLLVELAACWTLILLLTGLYLWWPKKRSQIWGTVLPRLRKKGRLFWRDLHAVPAFWLSIMIAVLIVTGLPWSGVMGEQINRLAIATQTGYPAFAFSGGEKPESEIVTKDVAKEGPWATENLPVPASVESSGHSIPLSMVAQLAQENEISKPYTITMPDGEKGVYSLTTSHTKPGDNATLHMDQYSGEILSDVRFEEYGLMAQGITLGIALHEGRLFGWPNQLLGALTCLGIVLLVFSAFVMWMKRKPKGTFGAPARIKDPKVKWMVLGIMFGLGILMPLVGLSILIVLVLDFMLLRTKRKSF